MADLDSTLTQEYLQSIFDYKDGELYWKENRYRNKTKGKKAGSLDTKGYRFVTIQSKAHRVHRVIFLMHYGYLPDFIDHINGNRLDNKIENLRPCSMAENARNCKKPKHNTSGYKGIRWRKDRSKWQVFFKVNKKYMSFGCYFDLEVAKFVAETMRYKYHKEFANNG